ITLVDHYNLVRSPKDISAKRDYEAMEALKTALEEGDLDTTPLHNHIKLCYDTGEGYPSDKKYSPAFPTTNLEEEPA
ncbi:MAG: hypothetical protein WBC82_10130, partial [Dehalococcoidia bacterium]